MDRTAMILGWMAGHLAAGRRRKKEPVACLYNGVRLPPVPEADTERYPYLYLLRNTTLGVRYVLHCSAVPYFKRVVNGGIQVTSDGVPAPRRVYQHMPEYDTDWSEPSDYENACYVASIEIIWCNTDLTDAQSGAVFMKGTEPVPVFAAQ